MNNPFNDMYASCYHLLNFLPGTKFVQRPTCVQWNTMPKNDTSLDIWSTLTTPGWCLDKCVGKNFTYAGVQGALCRCGNASPTFARVNLSECSWECEVERSQRCGGPMEWSVVGPGYPSVPAYCAYEYKYPLLDEFTRSPVPPSPDGGWHGWCIEKCASSGNYSYAGLMKQGECQCFCGARQPAREWVLEESKCENPDYLDYLDKENINTPGVCLARCRDRNYTYAGLGNAECYCAHASPEYARAHPSQCSQKCPGTNETCGAHKFFSVVGPGYPSIPAYCAHVESLPYFQYYDDTLQLGPEDCVKKCASRGHFSSAGLKGPRCYCGARLPARENAVEESKCDAPCDSPEHGCGGEDVISVYKVNKTSDAEYLAPEPPGLDWQLDSCVSKYTIPVYLDDRSNNTPGVCLDRCRDRNYTYAGVMRYECYCGHGSPEFAKVHPSQCSGSCPGDRNQTCGAQGYDGGFLVLWAQATPQSLPTALMLRVCHTTNTTASHWAQSTA